MHKFKLLVSAGILGLCGSTWAADDTAPTGNPMEDLDINDDGVISFVEFQESDRNILARLDTDQNDVLTLDEFLNARPTRGSRAGNNDGADAASEFSERREQMRARMTERATERFHAMDTDGDEIVSLAEFQEATFERMDSDSDGVLSASEMQEQRRGPPRGRRGAGGHRGEGGPRDGKGGQSPPI
jgi:hypothetical protein